MILKRPWLILALVSVLFACEEKEEDPPQQTEEQEAANAIPDDDMLAIVFGPDAGAGGGFGTVQQGLEGQSARIYEALQNNAERVDKARERILGVIDKLKTEGTLTRGVVGPAGGTCFAWELADETNEWKLLSCRARDGSGSHAFSLSGRPVGSDAARDWELVFAGSGYGMRAYQGWRRGAGVLGVNFDKVKELTGEGPTGKVSWAYRAAGPLRRVVAATKDFQPVDAVQAWNTVFTYGHVIGIGGSLQAAFAGDVLSRDTQGELSEEKDGVDELGRVAMAWTKLGKARLAAVACEGSVGAGECVAMRQCFEADGIVTWQEVVGLEETPQWSQTACPGTTELLDPVEEAPAEADLTPPTADGGDAQPGPVLQEIAEDPALEAE